VSGDAPVLLDSVIVIDHLNGVKKATQWLARNRSRCRITPITRAEVLCGYAPSDAAPIAAWLDGFPLIPIDREVGDLAATLRRDHGWKLPDAIQVAAARLHGLDLATRNTKDFPPRKFDFVVVPYSI
jgi:predicted nucleic acid-binding protein